MSKNILEVCLSPDLGGLELFMVHCLDFFQKKGKCKVVVAPQGKLKNYIQQEKFFVERRKLFPLFSAKKLASIIDKEEIDIVHFHWTKDILTVVLAKIMSKKKPKLIQTRNMTMTRFKDDFYHKWLYKNIDLMHAVTYQVKEQLEKFIPKDVRPRVEVVYMGTEIPQIPDKKLEELREKYEIKKDEFVIGIVGRIEEGKGQWLVIEALSTLKELPLKALIVGHTMDEAYLQTLKKKVKELGVEEKVIFTGFTKEVAEHMKLCNVTVLATPKETFGLVVIESMANGVPVVATKNGGPLEIIEDGVDGMLFDRSVEGLVDKIEQLYNDKELVSRLSLNAVTKVKDRFEKKQQLQKLYEVINES